MKVNPTKQKVLDAASLLFFQNGFHGTSVRDIADKASVNVSLISYYFKSKQGLLEYAVIHYYEAYLEILEEALDTAASAAPLEKIKKIITAIIQYKQEHHQFTCFVQRELSLDSIFVREMAVTYLAKENHYIRQAFFEVLDTRTGQGDRQFLYLQLKGMLITPYVLQHEWKDRVIGSDSRDYFVKKYSETIHQWLDFIVCGQEENCCPAGKNE